MFSTYFYELDETAKHCYREELDKAGLIDDPYVMQEQGIDSVNWQDWPRVEYPDVYNYLIQTPSLYTGESLRAYKSLDGYNFCVNGWVCATYTAYARRQTRYWFCQALTKALCYSSKALGCYQNGRNDSMRALHVYGRSWGSLLTYSSSFIYP